MERILALLADKSDYTTELATYLSTRKNFIFKPVLFSNISDLLRFNEEFRVDMLLCSEEDMSDELTSHIENVCYLSENNAVFEQDSDNGERHVIFKYQSSEAIMREITAYYSRRQQRDPAERAEFEANRRIVCICSPVGGAYSSTFALGLAAYYSLGGRTLLISFDPFFSFPEEEKNRAERNLTDLMYYMEVTQAGIADFVERLAHRHDSLDYVSGVSHWFDIADMSRKKMRRLLEALCSSDRYENIVFDLGITGEAAIELLLGCKTVYAPLKQGIGAQKAFEEWKRQLMFSNHSSVIEKTREFIVPYDELLDGEYTFETLLKGHLGRFIEDMEGLKYCR